MRRLGIFVFFIVAVLAGAAAWLLTAPTPQRVPEPKSLPTLQPAVPSETTVSEAAPPGAEADRLVQELPHSARLDKQAQEALQARWSASMPEAARSVDSAERDYRRRQFAGAAAPLALIEARAAAEDWSLPDVAREVQMLAWLCEPGSVNDDKPPLGDMAALDPVSAVAGEDFCRGVDWQLARENAAFLANEYESMSREERHEASDPLADLNLNASNPTERRQVYLSAIHGALRSLEVHQLSQLLVLYGRMGYWEPIYPNADHVLPQRMLTQALATTLLCREVQDCGGNSRLVWMLCNVDTARPCYRPQDVFHAARQVLTLTEYEIYQSRLTQILADLARWRGNAS